MLVCHSRTLPSLRLAWHDYDYAGKFSSAKTRPEILAVRNINCPGFSPAASAGSCWVFAAFAARCRLWCSSPSLRLGRSRTAQESFASNGIAPYHRMRWLHCRFSCRRHSRHHRRCPSCLRRSHLGRVTNSIARRPIHHHPRPPPHHRHRYLHLHQHQPRRRHHSHRPHRCRRGIWTS